MRADGWRAYRVSRHGEGTLPPGNRKIVDNQRAVAEGNGGWRGTGIERVRHTSGTSDKFSRSFGEF